MEAGKHIHLDKPPGESIHHLRCILDIAARKNLLVQMGYMYRYNPGVVLLRDFLNHGRLGDVFQSFGLARKVDRHLNSQLPGGQTYEK